MKPYVKGNKTDFIDAAAIAEAATRPDMRFSQPKSEQAQVIAATHRLREGFVSERTATMSRIGAILLEFGLSLPKGHSTMKRLFCWIGEQGVTLPKALYQELIIAHEHYLSLRNRVLIVLNTW